MEAWKTGRGDSKRVVGLQSRYTEGARVWSGAHVVSPPCNALALVVKVPRASFSPRKTGTFGHSVWWLLVSPHFYTWACVFSFKPSLGHQLPAAMFLEPQLLPHQGRDTIFFFPLSSNLPCPIMAMSWVCSRQGWEFRILGLNRERLCAQTHGSEGGGASLDP